mgnify:CR=1 FL=1
MYYDSLSFLDIKDLNDNELKELLRNIDLSFLKEKNQEGKLVFDSEKKLRDKMESIALRFKSTKRTAELFFMRRLLRCTSLEELAMYIEKSQGHITCCRMKKAEGIGSVMVMLPFLIMLSMVMRHLLGPY